jgi:hypothetical protein
MASKSELVRVLLDRYGTTHAEEAGISLADKPSPLYPVARAGALALRTHRRNDRNRCREGALDGRDAYAASHGGGKLAAVRRALGRDGYRRYDERTSTMLGAEFLLEEYRGDLRKLRERAEGTSDLERLLQEFKGIGPLGAAIFCREVQGLWTELAPYVDDRAAEGAACLRTGQDEKSAAEIRRATRADATA